MSFELLRLFVAITVPADVRNEIARVQQELRPLPAPKDVRWVKPEQFHLTLKFLGNVPADAVEAVNTSLANACGGISPFRLRAKGIGFFPNARSPRVIWVGFECDRNALVELQARIETSLATFAEKPAEEKFLPHATIGRFQKFRRHKTEKFLPQALSLRDHFFGEWRVDEVDLMQSDLSSAGARHKKLFSARL